MNWYYLTDAGEVADPVSAATLQELAAYSVIPNEMLVRKVNTTEWICQSLMRHSLRPSIKP